MVDLTSDAFDIGDKYRCPVMIMGDGMLGQMMEPVEFKDVDVSNLPEKEWATTGTGMKRKKNIINSLFLEASELEKLVLERQERYEKIAKNEVRYEAVDTEDADIILVAYGTTSRIAKTAMAKAKEQGLKVGIIRPITLWPFPFEAFNKALNGKEKKFLCVEMSTGQMVEDVKLAVGDKAEVHFFGRTGGIVPTPKEILNKIIELGGAK